MAFKLHLKEKDFDGKCGENILKGEKRVGREGKPYRNIVWLPGLIDMEIIFKIVMSNNIGKLSFDLKRSRES